MTSTHETNKPSYLRSALRIGFLLLAVVGANWLLNWVAQQSVGETSPTQKFMLSGLILLVLCAYALLIALPFVPGIEIGLGLMMMQGPGIGPLVYLFTVIGLTTAFLCGRLLSYEYLSRVLTDLGLRRAAALVTSVDGLDREARVDFLCDAMPDWLGRLMVNNRYLLLALAINIPGNALIGGGGGICLMAGLSRLFTIPAAVLTLALAVAPVPLLYYCFGVDLWH